MLHAFIVTVLRATMNFKTLFLMMDISRHGADTRRAGTPTPRSSAIASAPHPLRACRAEYRRAYLSGWPLFKYGITRRHARSRPMKRAESSAGSAGSRSRRHAAYYALP